MSSTTRTPAGVPTGGQFASTTHGESAVPLVTDAASAFDVETLVAQSQGWHAESADENGVILTRGHEERVRVEVDEDFGIVSCYDLTDDDPDSMPVAEATVERRGLPADQKSLATGAAARMLADLEWGDAGEKLQAEFSHASMEFGRAQQRQRVAAAHLAAHNVAAAYPEAVAIQMQFGDGDDTDLSAVHLVDAAGEMIGEQNGRFVPSAEHFASISTPLRAMDFFDDEWREKTGATSDIGPDPDPYDYNTTRVPVAGLRAVES